jgi:hypothetical protein
MVPPYSTMSIACSASMIRPTAPMRSFKLSVYAAFLIQFVICTMLELYREALELLKAVPRRDGLWDTEIVSRIAIELWGLRKEIIDLQIEQKGEQKCRV